MYPNAFAYEYGLVTEAFERFSDETNFILAH